MRSNRMRSLRNVIVFPVLLLELGAFLIIGWIVFGDFHQRFEEESRTRSEIIAYAARYIAAVAGPSAELSRSVQALGTERDVKHINVVFVDSGRIIASNRLGWRGKELREIPEVSIQANLLDTVLKGDASDLGKLGENEEEFNFATIFLLENITTHDRLEKAAVLVQLNTKAAKQKILNQLFFLGLALVAIMAVTTVMIIWLLNIRVFAPLREIGQALKRRSLENFSEVVPVSNNDEIGELAAALNETHEREAKAVEKLEESKEILAQSNAELEQFAYVASHDLQAPIRAIVGYSQFLKEELGGKHGEKIDLYVDRTIRAAINMQNLIRALLSLSRVKSQGRELVEVDCNSVLRNVLDILDDNIHAADAKITFDELPFICADSIQISSLFQNLIENAIKFSGKEAPRIHISSQSNGRSHSISVRDHGIGIGTEDRERVFQLFKRVHSQKEYPGSGVGLSICQKIVSRHGGQIWVDSPEQGCGTVFHFTLRSVD